METFAHTYHTTHSAVVDTDTHSTPHITNVHIVTMYIRYMFCVYLI